ncbi:hypothetical protein HM1_0102 [Heliomicrobium modesticaldum Ice1]|uniref:Uncharacterized protein n=1 Tax=Heliobacterium modesticaldum (strain ATCC 51547 / Ice1) TaxID=498761 RepID=B0TD29_HELMI|nr:hypothetical protein HM1_0102 [Heliomicrobium modesticaldum Ice1]
MIEDAVKGECLTHNGFLDKDMVSGKQRKPGFCPALALPPHSSTVSR